MTEILGYGTTNATEVLNTFIANAEAQYTALEQAIAPVDEKIADLQKDWVPRPVSFWAPILRTPVPAIRKATSSCLDLFDRERSQGTPVPIIMSATHLGYMFDLFSVETQIEEVGILLTAHLHSPDPERSVEAQIGERQRLMKALQELSKVVHKAIDNARPKLASAPEEQRQLLRPPKKKRSLHVVEGGKPS